MQVTMFQLVTLYSIVGLAWGYALFGSGSLFTVQVNYQPSKAPYVRPSRRKIPPLLGQQKVEPLVKTELPPIPTEAKTKVSATVAQAKQRLKKLEGNA